MKEAENEGAHFEGVVGTVKSVPWVEEEQLYFVEKAESGTQLNPVPALQRPSYRIDKNQNNRIDGFNRSRRKELKRCQVRIRACRNFQTMGKQVWDLPMTFLPSFLLTYILSGVPFAIIGGLTHFRKGDSTITQQVFVLGWIGFGTAAGSIIPPMFRLYSIIQMYLPMLRKVAALFVIVFLLLYSTFAIGGMVIVGLMLVDYGSCNRLKGI
jgi:hypothetical protein